MEKKPPKSPQSKKALSYAKDRRNTYGANDKASRKAIPLRKAIEHRQDRRKVAQHLGIIQNVAEEVADLIESSAIHDIPRVGGWKKSADEPIGKIVANSRTARDARVGRKMRTAEAVAGAIPDDPEALMRMAKRLRRIGQWVARRSPKLQEFAKTFGRSADDLETRAASLRLDT